MKTRHWAGLALVAVTVAACTGPQVPDSGQGVGFGDYAEYELQRLEREAALTGQPLDALRAPEPATTAGPNPNAAIPTSELAAAGIGTQVPDGGASGGLGDATTVDPSATAVTTPDVTAAALDDPATTAAAQSTGDGPLANNPTLSDEQDFSAVTARETIESDAERRAQQVENLVVVEPVPLPATRADSGPNIVEYAINAPNRKGQPWWSRSLLSGDTRFQRNCATYGSPDEAQRDFMRRGGPERDPRGLDPDGDGFACGWDPQPFIAAAGN